MIIPPINVSGHLKKHVVPVKTMPPPPFVNHGGVGVRGHSENGLNDPIGLNPIH